jgi:hypothetical protein
VRHLLSKSIAGGLSAGVVLLWWPVLFDRVDTVTSWFVRGVAWTVCFELLLVALVPFERALWETTGGERISTRIGAAGSRLHAGSRRRRMGRLSAVATVALALPVALLVAGLGKHAPAPAEAKAATPVKVVRVTKVVKVVKRAPAAVQPSTGTPVIEQAAPAPAPSPTHAPAPAPERTTVEVGQAAPEERKQAPEPKAEVVEDAEPPAEGGASGGEAPAAPPSSF